MSITVEEANTSLLDLLERVRHGEEFRILKDGLEVARLLPSIASLPLRVPGTAATVYTQVRNPIQITIGLPPSPLLGAVAWSGNPTALHPQFWGS